VKVETVEDLLVIDADELQIINYAAALNKLPENSESLNMCIDF